MRRAALATPSALQRAILPSGHGMHHTAGVPIIIADQIDNNMTLSAQTRLGMGGMVREERQMGGRHRRNLADFAFAQSARVIS